MSNTFGQRLTSARHRRDYTQAGLAKASKINPTQIAHFEGDKREPAAENIRRLARALDISADYLLGLSGSTKRLSEE